MRKTSVHDRLALELKAAREKAGISQRDMAHRLGTNQTAVCFIENGTQSVRVTDLIAWCEILTLDPCEVLRASFSQTNH